MGRIPYPILQQWKSQIRTSPSPFIAALPKIELHIHLEGTLTPESRFMLAQRNSIPLTSTRLNKTFTTVEELQTAYLLFKPPANKGPGVSAFFEAYYGGMECLITEEDFYELAMGYFTKAHEMGVRYCEVMFDPQAHTRRGIPIPTFMSGIRRAQIDAEDKFNIKVQYILCILRDLPIASAMQHYEDIALPYRHIIAGIGLDGTEFAHPPSLFTSLFTRAKTDGFKTTAHSDVAQPDALLHIREILTPPLELDRVDHGLDVARSEELMGVMRERGVGVTICPWAYVRHMEEGELFGGIKRLVEGGVKFCVASDSPAYMEGCWVVDNLEVLAMRARFSEEKLVECQRVTVGMCWAGEQVKRGLLEEIDGFWEGWKRRIGELEVVV